MEVLLSTASDGRRWMTIHGNGAVAAAWQRSVLLYVDGKGPLLHIAAVGGIGGRCIERGAVHTSAAG